jgi:hypothetical protein
MWQTDAIGLWKCGLGLSSHILVPIQLQQQESWNFLIEPRTVPWMEMVQRCTNTVTNCVWQSPSSRTNSQSGSQEFHLKLKNITAGNMKITDNIYCLVYVYLHFRGVFSPTLVLHGKLK